MYITDKEVESLEKMSLRRITKKIADKSINEETILFKLNLYLLKLVDSQFFEKLNNTIIETNHFELIRQLEIKLNNKNMDEKKWYDIQMKLWAFFIQGIPERPIVSTLNEAVSKASEIRKYELYSNLFLFYSFASLPRPEAGILFQLIYRFCRTMAWIDTIKEGRAEHDMLFLFHKKRVNIELNKFFKAL